MLSTVPVRDSNSLDYRQTTLPPATDHSPNSPTYRKPTLPPSNMNAHPVFGGVGQFFSKKSAAARERDMSTAVKAGEEMLANLKKEIRHWLKDLANSAESARVEQCLQKFEQQDIEMAELTEAIKTKMALVADKEKALAARAGSPRGAGDRRRGRGHHEPVAIYERR